MNDFNDDKIKKAIESAEVPEQISPENMKIMLDEKAPQKKRSKITHKAMRFTAGAAACAVICGVGVHYAGQTDLFDKKESQCLSIAESSQNAIAEVAPEDNHNGGSSKPINTFMYSLKDYEELYSMFEDAYDEYGSDFRYESTNVFLTSDGVAVDESAMEDAEASVETQSPSNGVAGIGSADDEDGSEDYSETYNQEEGVLEADVYKTDGEYIYYLHTGFYDDNFDYNRNLYINAARADGGSLVDEVVYDITDDFPVGEEELVDLRDMYLYNDMLIVIGNSFNNYGYCSDSVFGSNEIRTYVSVYTTDNGLKHVDSYMQDGSYNDVRITPDGYMYLITDDYSSDFNSVDGAEDLESYIPTCGFGDYCDFIPADSILLPEDDLDSCNSISYTIVGGLDFNNPGSFNSTDIKAIAGFSGNIYCSGGNLYLASGWEDTDITRIALDAGTVIPAAEGTVKGRIKDQFSMSEYNGYFRIATTHETWRESIEIFDGMEIASYGRDGIENFVYVLDMDLNKVGKTESFGIDETIKSVSFSGDLAYVVTYEQTDPLFSIDLSNPSAPVILDEFKILGYSTYMQQWSDGLLLGYGVDADEYGFENGYKLVMFDNSDPNNLEEVGVVKFGESNGESMEYSYSMATWERKSLLIAPEKNLIGVPIITEIYNDENWGTISAYRFYSYENGSFTYKGEISLEKYNSIGSKIILDRAAYIGDYVYVLGEYTFIAADAATITQTDIVEFTRDMAVVPEDIGNAPVESVTSTEPSTEILTEPTTESPTEPESDTEIVFVDRMTNEIDDRGSFIDIDGNVYKFDFCSEALSKEEFVEKLYEICETEEPVMTVDADIIYDCWEKISEINADAEIIDTYTGSADMGQSSLYAVSRTDELVLLHSEGDYIRENSDAVAKEIYELYFELWN